MVIALSSCATLINLAINPQGVANQLVNDTVKSISEVNVNDINNAASGDIERILREHPDATNRAQLTDLKENLAGQTLASKQIPRDDLQRERAAEHDRRIPRRDRRRTDNVVLGPLTQYQEVPYGIKTTPLSHYPQDGLPLPERSYVSLETNVLRFDQ
jgi:hypothetical protein